ncbi:cell wall hydrolase [Methylobacterium sp. Leaf118]|uniref:cell wall hydrolase n=1 Tax=Methylobacterium sp. Leaf118 TaxID=2876562 RepID=UPI001E5D16C7|nr:cell wall hydrolase [Methylobacterium sp. Leaf118]
MRNDRNRRIACLAALAIAGSGLGGCNLFRPQGELTTGSIAPNAKVVQAPSAADKECLARAMYFESNRSDEEGLLAVGTVVMNRLDAPAYPGRICEVVGQKRQFANGVLTKPVRDQDRPRLEKVADLILSGQRHEGVGQALHFHTAGYSFPYKNMHYVVAAGGNVFYEKSDREGYLPAHRPQAVVQVASGRLMPLQVAAAQSGMIGLPLTGRVQPTLTAEYTAPTAPELRLPGPARYASVPGRATSDKVR